MAQEIRHFSVTIPAGTPLATPTTTDISFPDRVVRRIDWKVPPGANGQMGFRFASGGVSMIPDNAGTFIVTDDQEATWPVDGQINTGAWQLQGYNVGTYPHTVYLTFFLDLVDVAGAAGVGFSPPLAVGEVV